MTPKQIEFLKSLDKGGCDGTIQSILLGKDLNTIPYQSVLEFVLTQIKKEKDLLVQDNIRLSKEINQQKIGNV